LSVWTERDLPMLKALVESDNEHLREGFLYISEGSDPLGLGLGLEPSYAIDGIYTLQDAGYVQFDEGHETFGGPNLMATSFSVTGAGMQALGEWPMFETVADPELLAAVLERLAPEAPTDGETTATRAAAGYVRTVAPGVLRSLLSSAVSTLLRSHGVPI
jgi:hypothetical protein